MNQINNQKNTSTASAPKLDIEKIVEQVEKLKKAEINEKEWLKKQQIQQSF